MGTTTVLLMCTATLHELNVNGILIQCTCMTCTLCVITRTYMHAYMHVHVNQSNHNKCMFWNKRAYETEIGFDFLWPWAIKIKLYHMLLLEFIAWQMTKFCPIFCLLNVICRTCNSGLFYITWTIFKRSSPKLLPVKEKPPVIKQG